jgi:cytochrome c-type biogenesis protein
VVFREGSTARGTVTVSGGNASLTLSDVPAGTHSYTASFVPADDLRHASSTSSARTVDVVATPTATALGSAFQDHEELLSKVAAALIIAMGILFVASLFVTRLNREWHVDALLERAGKGGPIVAGAAFAIAWTPCIGPTLGAILTAASLSGSAAHGAFLLVVYSAGLAIPFLLTAVAFSRMTTAFTVVKRHYQAIVATGGVILIAMGVLIWTNELTQLNSEAQRWLSGLGLDFWNSV